MADSDIRAKIIPFSIVRLPKRTATEAKNPAVRARPVVGHAVAEAVPG